MEIQDILINGVEVIIKGHDAIESIEMIIDCLRKAKEWFDYKKAIKIINEYYQYYNDIINENIDELEFVDLDKIYKNQSKKQLQDNDEIYIIVNSSTFRKRMKKWIENKNYEIFKRNIRKYIYEGNTEVKIKKNKINEQIIEWYIAVALAVLANTEGFDQYANDIIENRIQIKMSKDVKFLKEKMNNFSEVSRTNVIQELGKRVEKFNTKNYSENFKEVDELYETYKSNIELMASVGYILADIFERNSEFEKSVEIINWTVIVYKTKCEEIFSKTEVDSKIAKKMLRKYIGSVYSYAIADLQDLEKNNKIRNIAQKEFKVIKKYKDMFVNNEKCAVRDKEFIIGIYDSDYAAFLINKGKAKCAEGLDDEATKYFEAAKRTHKEALNERKHLIEKLEENSEEYNEINKMIGVSYRNIGASYFYLENYDKSIENHKKAINIFYQMKEKEQYYNTQEYIIGSYIAKAKKNPSNINVNELKDCLHTIEGILMYYGEYPEHKKYKKAEQHKEKIYELLGNNS